MEYKFSEEDYAHGGVQKDFYNADEVENWDCPLCGSTRYQNIHNERGHLGIVECEKCNLLFTNPKGKDAEKNYFGDATTFYEEAKLIFEGKEKHHRDKNYEFELNQIKKVKPGGKLLDIGTNMGFFLNKAKEFGYETEGVEPSPALAKIAVKEFSLKIRNSYFKREDFIQKSFDIITMIDVFEHVTSPQLLLNDAFEVLKDDGILCIKVPNGDYNKTKLKLAKILNKDRQFDIFNAYEHVVHYTPDTMKKMLGQGNFNVKNLILPIPIHSPVWASLEGHYYQHQSPFMKDWKRITARNLCYWIGKAEKALGWRISFAPDLMFIIEKSTKT